MTSWTSCQRRGWRRPLGLAIAVSSPTSLWRCVVALATPPRLYFPHRQEAEATWAELGALPGGGGAGGRGEVTVFEGRHPHGDGGGSPRSWGHRSVHQAGTGAAKRRCGPKIWGRTKMECHRPCLHFCCPCLRVARSLIS